MPALLRYFSDLIHFKTSKLNPIPLHGNPILDNFVFKHAAVQTGRTFASAHSCGLRPRTMMIFCNLQIFASAHSCGLRQWDDARSCAVLTLPQRIRAGCDKTAGLSANEYMLCLSAFARVATLRPFSAAHGGTIFATAHSCGLRRSSTCGSLNAISLCHSAFVRVATQMRELTVPLLHLCHSAFVRVATQQEPEEYRQTHFATAHSCGLRLFECGRNCSKAGFATAHSCGLRR